MSVIDACWIRPPDHLSRPSLFFSSSQSAPVVVAYLIHSNSPFSRQWVVVLVETAHCPHLISITIRGKADSPNFPPPITHFPPWHIKNGKKIVGARSKKITNILQPQHHKTLPSWRYCHRQKKRPSDAASTRLHPNSLPPATPPAPQPSTKLPCPQTGR